VMDVREMRSPAIKGAGALSQMLDCIGAAQPNGDPIGDHTVARILVDNELDLRAFLDWSLWKLSLEK
jgi:hypothetical protein